MFPLFFDLKQKKCLIVGGGKVAWRKAKTLLAFCGNLQIVAPKFCPELQQCTELQPYLHKRAFTWEDLDGVFFVVAATSDQQLNQTIVERCNTQKILVNSATCHSFAQTVAFPSVIQQGEVTIGINSGGNPALSKALRKRITAALPEDLSEKSQLSKEYRQQQMENRSGKALKQAMEEEVNKLL